MLNSLTLSPLGAPDYRPSLSAIRPCMLLATIQPSPVTPSTRLANSLLCSDHRTLKLASCHTSTEGSQYLGTTSPPRLSPQKAQASNGHLWSLASFGSAASSLQYDAASKLSIPTWQSVDNHPGLVLRLPQCSRLWIMVHVQYHPPVNPPIDSFPPSQNDSRTAFVQCFGKLQVVAGPEGPEGPSGHATDPSAPTNNLSLLNWIESTPSLHFEMCCLYITSNPTMLPGFCVRITITCPLKQLRREDRSTTQPHSSTPGLARERT